jgi:stage II sporulation protein D
LRLFFIPIIYFRAVLMRKYAVLLSVFALIVLGGLAMLRYRENMVIRERVESFVSLAAAGRHEEAVALFLGPEEELEWFFYFLREGFFRYEQLKSVEFQGVNQAQAELEFAINGQEQTLTMKLQKHHGGWMITGFHRVEYFPAALFLWEKSVAEGYRLRVNNAGGERELLNSEKLDLGSGSVVRIIAIDEQVFFCEELQSKSISKLVSRSANQLEGELEGSFSLKEESPVYHLEGDKFTVGTESDLILGMEELQFHLDKEQEVAAVSITRSYRPELIRVALNRTGFNGLTHSSLELTSSFPLTLAVRKIDFEQRFPAGTVFNLAVEGEKITVSPQGYPAHSFDERISFFPEEGGTVELLSLERGPGPQPFHPLCRGHLEITRWGEELIVINELPLEQYLYSVVPSEMPLRFGLEPLKVQAVAARAFAVASIYRGLYFNKYGAHVDDSTSSQVYNNIKEDPLSTAAVEQTAGLVPFYKGEIVDARFFSTSAGYTANAHEVWTNVDSKDFPGEEVPYLIARSQVPGKGFDLSKEEELKNFLKRKDLDAYDQRSPYFRWQITLSAEELAESIRQNLALRYSAKPDCVLTFDQMRKEFVSREIPRDADPLGELLDLRVVRRGEGGNIMVLDLEGTEGTYRLISEYTIRFTLRPVQYLPGREPVTLHTFDGKTISNYAILPSAFAWFDIYREASGTIEKVTIYGGGNGHGVGMSQYGALGMAERGFTFAEILKHYYPGSELIKLY